MEIRNTSPKPIRVPLPGGKKLHLVPGRTGQIQPKAADFPPLKKLIEAGEVEIVGEGRTKGVAGRGNKGVSESQGRSSQGGVRHTGDR